MVTHEGWDGGRSILASARRRPTLVAGLAAAAGILGYAVSAGQGTPSRAVAQAVAGLLLGLGLGVALAHRRTGSGARIGDRHEAERVLGAPLLGTLPVYEHARGEDSITARLDIDPGPQEAYHFVLSSLLHELFARGGSTVMVTSANPGDGKTEVSLQLAAASVREGRPAMLVDGDLRMRRLTRLVDAEGAPGLLDLPPDAGGAEQRLLRRPFHGDLALEVLPAGDATAGVAVRQPGIAAWFRRARDEGTLAIVDSAPILATADTTVLADHVDGLVLVLRKGVERDLLERVAERLRFADCAVLGYVYVTPSEREHRGSADYGYGYGDGYRTRPVGTTASPRPEPAPTPEAPAPEAPAPDTRAPETPPAEPAAPPPPPPPLRRASTSSAPPPLLATRAPAAAQPEPTQPEPAQPEPDQPEPDQPEPDEHGAPASPTDGVPRAGAPEVVEVHWTEVRFTDARER